MATSVDHLEEAAARTYAWFALLPSQGVHVTREGQLAKVREESQEFIEEPSLEEAADVFITLIGSLALFGWSVTDLAVAVDTKMAINEKRTWAKMADGSYHSTKEN